MKSFISILAVFVMGIGLMQPMYAAAQGSGKGAESIAVELSRVQMWALLKAGVKPSTTLPGPVAFDTVRLMTVKMDFNRPYGTVLVAGTQGTLFDLAYSNFNYEDRWSREILVELMGTGAISQSGEKALSNKLAEKLMPAQRYILEHANAINNLIYTHRIKEEGLFLQYINIYASEYHEAKKAQKNLQGFDPLAKAVTDYHNYIAKTNAINAAIAKNKIDDPLNVATFKQLVNENMSKGQPLAQAVAEAVEAYNKEMSSEG